MSWQIRQLTPRSQQSGFASLISLEMFMSSTRWIGLNWSRSEIWRLHYLPDSPVETSWWPSQYHESPFQFLLMVRGTTFPPRWRRAMNTIEMRIMQGRRTDPKMDSILSHFSRDPSCSTAITICHIPMDELTPIGTENLRFAFPVKMFAKFTVFTHKNILHQGHSGEVAHAVFPAPTVTLYTGYGRVHQIHKLYIICRST